MYVKSKIKCLDSLYRSFAVLYISVCFVEFFQGLFRNFGSCFVENLKPSVERLVRDLSHDKHDSSQRCAMEIIGGILRGSKHWEYSQVNSDGTHR